MLKDISIGRYFQGDSVMHRLDPRVKVIYFVAYMIVIFCMNKPLALAGLFALAGVLMVAANVPLKVMWNTIKPILPIVMIIFILNLFTMKRGEVLWQWWKLAITVGGVKQAVLMAYRLIMLISITSLMLTLTTTPLLLSSALESLGSPLKKLKISVHEMAMMMSIALRFIPTLVVETDKIMMAQTSRGANYDTGSLFNRVKGYVTVLVPLFVSSFRRAEELAVAMDARCYVGGEGRTKLNPLKLTRKDIVISGLLLVGLVVLILLQNIG